jgi:cell division protease FtsH
MVTMFGMSTKVGLAHFGEHRPAFLAGENALAQNCSPKTAHEIDQEVQAILSECYKKAQALLKHNRAVLNDMAHELIAKETLEGMALQGMLSGVRTLENTPVRKPVAL